MVSDYRIRLALRVAVLAGSLAGTVWVGMRTDLMATTLLLGAVSVLAAWDLFRVVDRTNRDLARFLTSVRYEDFTQTFPAAGTDSFATLNQAFTEVIRHFKDTRAEKEEHYHYLQTVVQHVGVGLMSYKTNGDIDLYNPAAKRLFRHPNPRNIRAFEYLSAELVDVLATIRAGERRLVNITAQDDILHVSVHATELKLRDQHYMLVSLQNIQSELEEKELEAWHSLIRVLTHEMMNSVTPISSLASTAHGLLGDGRRFSEEDAADVRNALDTIRRRSDGLLRFVETYRQLTRIPKPDYKILAVTSLFEDVVRLMGPDLDARGISMIIQTEPESLEVTADPDLVEQVLLNLVGNARDALEGQKDGVIVLNGLMDDRGRVVLTVSDNGPGIEASVLGSVFIPFFTTKPAGSGIGLSLSRQIMRMHHGTLTVRSDPGAMTVFSLRF